MDTNGKDFYSMYVEKIEKKGGPLGYATHKENGPVGAMVKRISRFMEPKSRILEIGTGSGVLAALLARRGFSVMAIDNDDRMLSLARECALSLRVDIEFEVVDAFRLLERFGPMSFDCVVSYGLMEHFSDRQIIELLNTQKRVGKKVVFCVPSGSIAMKYQKKGNGTERYLGIGEWNSIIGQTDSRKDKAFGFGFGSKSRFNLPDSFSNNDLTARLFAGFAGFYEFWM